MALTMRDVARQAGVAVGTVSNVLNGLETVSSENRTRVLAAVDAIGYVRNESARQLKAGLSSTVGLLLEDTENPFYAELATGVERAAAGQDFSVFVCTASQSRERELSYLSVLEENRVRGIIVATTLADSVLSDRLAAIERRGTPVVLVGQSIPGSLHAAVTSDNEKGGFLAVEHLLELGHRDIAMLVGSSHIPAFRERVAGAERAIRPYREARLRVVEGDSQTIEQGAILATQLFEHDQPPTAIFGANDLLALGALQFAFRARVEVPGKLAVIGYDGSLFAAGAQIPLSSISTFNERMGTEAARLLFSLLDHPQSQRNHLVIEPRLVARASSIGLI